MGFGVKALRNSVFDAGFQCPKVVNGAKSGIENSGFASSVVVRQQTAHLALTISFFCGLRELLLHRRDKLIVGGLGDDPVEL